MPLHEKINYCCCLYVLTLTLSQAWYEGLCVPCLTWIYLAYSVTSRLIIEYREPKESTNFIKILWALAEWQTFHLLAKVTCQDQLVERISRLRKNVLTIVDVTMTLKWRSHHHKDVYLQPFEDTVALVTWIYVDGEKG